MADKTIVEQNTMDPILEESEDDEVSSHGSQPLFSKITNNEDFRRHVDRPYFEYDQKRHDIHVHMKRQFKHAPKPLQQKAEESKSGIEKQLEDNDKHLEKLIEFGDDLVTNIRVANERREVLRKSDVTVRKSDLSKRVRNESVQAIAEYNNISSKWSELGLLKEPMSLYENMNDQKERIETLMKNKDDLIEQCQDELKRINDKYYDDQEKQSNDICNLIERVDNQIEIIKCAYEKHVHLLEETIEDERKTIALKSSNKWNEFYDTVNTNEEKKFSICKEKEMFYADEIERITAKQEEITRTTRVRLEKDAEILECEVRRVKNNILMNSEKLDYNYQVLQKRNEENVIINNQQKRRVAKLHETISTLKKKIHHNSNVADVTIRRLTNDIQKLHSSISELEKKLQQFKINNKRKFDRVWEINFKETKQLLLKVFEIDKILYEQQLIIPWKMPEVDFTDINKRSDTDAQEGKSRDPFKNHKEKYCRKEDEVRFLRNILRHIADRAGFLVEEKLLKILEPYKKEQKYLVKIENVFTALRISDLNVVRSLTEFFEPYAKCANCDKRVSTDAIENLYNTKMELKGRAETLPKDNTTCETCTNHQLVMEPTLVLTALNDFVKKTFANESAAPGYTNHDIDNDNLITLEDDEILNFWEKFNSYMPTEKQKLWMTLEHGLNHYLEVLKQRDELNTECIFLRKQNTELKHLLKKFRV